MMKRKIALMGLAMATFSPHILYAMGLSKEGYTLSYYSGASSYEPHYGDQERVYPLMDHLSAPDALPQRNTSETWRLELAPPATVTQSLDDPLMGKDKRVGVTFKLDF
jgi:hypothetical protein